MVIRRPLILPTLGTPVAVQAQRRRSNMLRPDFYEEKANIRQVEQPSPKEEEQPTTADYLAAQIAKFRSRPAPPKLDPASRVKTADSSIAAPANFQHYYQRLGFIDETGQESLRAAQARAAYQRMQAMSNIGVGGPAQQQQGSPNGQLRYTGSGNVMGWINEAAGVLKQHGINLSPQDLQYIGIIIQHESGGNPNAINNWDSNAAKGTPSKGLMQTIDPTFNGNKLPGFNDIYNPVHNIIAGVRYAIRRYGSLANVPGIRGLNSGGKYVGY